MMRVWVLWMSIIVAMGLAGCDRGSASTEQARDLSEYRQQHPTKLTRHGPPPESWQDPTPLVIPVHVREVTYPSGQLKLKAWISDIPDDGKLRPAVVFCHGGFWFGNEDWDVLQPFIDAGFVVMSPRMRGENGNPGDFEYYYSEVDDVIAAGQYLASLRGVDKERVFVSGHSAGADLALLAAMKPNPYVMCAPIGASLDIREVMRLNSRRHQDLVVFDRDDRHELESRCAMLFAPSLRCPAVLFHGTRDWRPDLQDRFASLAKQAGHDASVVTVPGDHMQAQTTAIPRIVALFERYQPR